MSTLSPTNLGTAPVDIPDAPPTPSGPSSWSSRSDDHDRRPLDDPGAGTARTTVRYFAGAKAAAGRSEEQRALPAGADVDALLSAMAAEHGDALERVLAASSFLLDGQAVRDRAQRIPDGAVLDVLPPFAGG